MYIKSSRGGEKYIADGYMYIYDKTSMDGKFKFWRCEFKSDKCRARLHTSVETNQVVKKLNDHTHKPDPQRIVATQMRNLLKRKAEIISSVPVIKAEIIEPPKEDCTTIFQPVVYIKEEPEYKVARIEEEETNSLSSLNATLEYTDIPKGLRKYDLGRHRKINFLLDDFNGTNEMLVFAREDYKDWANFMKTIYIDSTFKRCPYTYTQICVITTERNGHAFAIMYILLRDISDDSYKKLFHKIKRLWVEFNPTVIYVDYAKTSLKALKTAFPTATIFGCYFHLKDMFIEKIEEYQLQNKYYNDMEFAIQTRMIIAVAFVPKKDIDKATKLLQKRLPEDVIEIFDWFQETFITEKTSEKSKPTKYPFEMWSMYNKVLNGEYCTSNAMESVNRQTHSELETNNLLVSQFIFGFQVIQRTSDTTYDAFIRGETPPVKNVQERLIYLVKTYKDRTLYEYMRGIAANIY